MVIGSDSVKYQDCATHDTKILAESNVIKVILFEQDGIIVLISSFNAKVYDLKNSLHR